LTEKDREITDFVRDFMEQNGERGGEAELARVHEGGA